MGIGEVTHTDIARAHCVVPIYCFQVSVPNRSRKLALAENVDILRFSTVHELIAYIEKRAHRTISDNSTKDSDEQDDDDETDDSKEESL